jgi:hypothetical protein
MGDSRISGDRSGEIRDLQQAARLYQEDNDLKSYQSVIALLKKWQTKK